MAKVGRRILPPQSTTAKGAESFINFSDGKYAILASVFIASTVELGVVGVVDVEKATDAKGRGNNKTEDARGGGRAARA